MLMTRFSQWIGALLAGRGWQQKRLAYEWQAKVGEGSAGTYESRLSKIMNDDDAGYDYLLDDPARLAAFAELLGASDDEVRRRVEAEKRRPTVVLDPRLDRRCLRFFERRAELSEGELDVAVPEQGGDAEAVREAMRQLAAEVRNPVAALSTKRDLDFFRGAGVNARLVIQDMRGFHLDGMEGLTAPLPPRLHDDDGMPLVPWPELEDSCRAMVEDRDRNRHAPPPSEQDRESIERIRAADAEGREPSFRLERLASPPSGRELAAMVLHAVFEDQPERAHRTPRADDSYIWFHRGRIMAIGGRRSLLLEAVRRHHEVADVAAFGPLVDKLKRIAAGMNPCGEAGDFDLDPELQALREETGGTDHHRHCRAARARAKATLGVDAGRRDRTTR